jgi:hypothetical protein
VEFLVADALKKIRGKKMDGLHGPFFQFRFESGLFLLEQGHRLFNTFRGIPSRLGQQSLLLFQDIGPHLVDHPDLLFLKPLQLRLLLLFQRQGLLLRGFDLLQTLPHEVPPFLQDLPDRFEEESLEDKKEDDEIYRLK